MIWSLSDAYRTIRWYAGLHRSGFLVFRSHGLRSRNSVHPRSFRPSAAVRPLAPLLLVALVDHWFLAKRAEALSRRGCRQWVKLHRKLHDLLPGRLTGFS